MTDRYGHLSREELISLLQKRDATRKLGLVWERDEIDHEHALNDDFVALELDESLSVGHPPFENYLIEGDNFDALRYLHIAYRGRVKCIYIDPPYNLGGNDFIYNDNYVDKEDGYRHSKWLEFMYRRLLLAKDLLADDGVIFVSIDDTEYAHLSLLMEQVFPGKRVANFVWRRRIGANDEKDWFVSSDHEYVLCYANKGFSFAGHAKDKSLYSNPDNDPREDWISNPLIQGKNFKQRADAFYSIRNPITDTWYPCDPDNVWRFASKDRVGSKKIRTSTMEELIDDNRIAWPENERTVVYQTVDELKAALEDGTAPRNLRVYLTLDELRDQVRRGQAPERLLNYIEPLENWVGRNIGYGAPRLKRFWNELKNTQKPVSTWILPSALKKNELEAIDLSEVEAFTVGYTMEGTSLLAQMIGSKDFPYPKPLSLVKSLVGQATDAESGHIVMDFFAGSGTTGHAVLALNAEDNGNRTFILVSSTEATTKDPDKNVCRDITAKRLRAAIQGYSYRTPKGPVTVEGVGGEFAYMRTTRIPKETVAFDIRHDQVWFTLQQLHANAISPFRSEQPVQILLGEDNSPDILYVPELDEKALEQLRQHFDESLKPGVVYSWQPGIILQRLNFNHIRVEKIPDYIIGRFGR